MITFERHFFKDNIADHKKIHEDTECLDAFLSNIYCEIQKRIEAATNERRCIAIVRYNTIKRFHNLEMRQEARTFPWKCLRRESSIDTYGNCAEITTWIEGVSAKSTLRGHPRVSLACRVSWNLLSAPDLRDRDLSRALINALSATHTALTVRYRRLSLFLSLIKLFDSNCADHDDTDPCDIVLRYL